MKITLKYKMTEEESIKFSDKGWTIIKYKDDDYYEKFVDENGLMNGLFISCKAIKIMPSPAHALWEIEKILGIDIIFETDNDSCSIISIYWDDEKIENKDGHLGHASEWDLAKIMYNFEEDKRGLLDKVFKEYKAKILSEI